MHVGIRVQDLGVIAVTYQVDGTPQECVLSTLAETVNWNQLVRHIPKDISLGMQRREVTVFPQASQFN
jgi:hypothetical protein